MARQRRRRGDGEGWLVQLRTRLDVWGAPERPHRAAAYDTCGRQGTVRGGAGRGPRRKRGTCTGGAHLELVVHGVREFGEAGWDCTGDGQIGQGDERGRSAERRTQAERSDSE
jgi:hypothetical protein